MTILNMEQFKGSVFFERNNYDKKLICKLFTYLRTTVYPSVTIYLLIAYFNWDMYWIEKQSNVISRIAFVVILSLVRWVYDEKED